MSSIWKYMSPLWTFILGMMFTLLMTIFFPAIFNAQTQLASETASYGSNFWGWTEVVTSIRLIVFLVCVAVTLLTTAIVWLKRKG
jgi:hypothetical protein